MPSLLFFQEHKRLRPPVRGLKALAVQLLAREGCRGSGANIILTGNRQIQSLNRRFRKKDKPTDVLSFNFEEPGFLGEVYISLDKARSQAREYGATFEEEIRRLLIHGLFHLLGYTHYRRKERLRMEKKEEWYLK